MSEFNFFMPIAKLEKQPDGTCIVSGYASTPTKDSDGEEVTLGAIKKALPDYMRWRNIREMHQLRAVGKAQEANIDTKGLWLAAKISDPVAVQKCIDKVYQGFSIGGRKLATVGNKIKEIELTEISVVDRPANPDCTIALAKSFKELTKEDAGFLLEAPPKLSAEQKALRKMAKVVSTLTRANSIAKATEPSPKDDADQNNKSVNNEKKCEKHGVVDCEKCAVEKRDFDTKERDAAASSGVAMPDGSFPIKTVEDLHNAVSLAGNAKDPDKAKAHIKTRAKALNAEDKLPDTWGDKKKGKKEAKKLVKLHLQQSMDINGNSFLFLQKPEVDDIIEPLAKGMGTAGSLAYCFDSIRAAQRSLLSEAKREGGDMKDKALAKQLGAIAKDLAEVIAQKATHEGEEGLDLSDADDQWMISILGEDFDMNKVIKTVGGSGDPLADALRGMLAKAAQPSRMQRMEMAKSEIKKARKACKMAREAVEEAHKMHKAAYMSKAAKKPEDKDEGFDHQGAMEKLQKAFAEINKARTFGKAASTQMEKAAGRAGQKGQEAGDAEPGVYEVPEGVTDLSPTALATASPGGEGKGSMPPIYPVDGGVYAGKADGSTDLRKYMNKDGSVPAAVAELLLEKAKGEGELEALRRAPVGGGRNGNRPFSFDMSKVVAGTTAGHGGDTRELNKALFHGVDASAIGSGNENAHTREAAKVIGNFLTTTSFGKSMFDPSFKGLAGSNA